MPKYLLAKESFELLIYLAYIFIILRIIPVSLQWLSVRRKNLAAQFFFQFSVLSLGADIACIVLIYFNFQTDLVFFLYQIGELIIATFLALEIGRFNKKIRYFQLFICFAQVISFLSLSINVNLNALQDYIAGISKLYILILTFFSALNYIRNSESNRKIDIAPLIGLLGIFIFEALSIIPFISLQLQILYGNPQQITIYLILAISSNIIRDILVSYNAIINIKKSV